MGRCSIWLQRVDRRTSDLLDSENVGGGEEQIVVCHVARRVGTESSGWLTYGMDIQLIVKASYKLNKIDQFL
jgi:hypothetical protein